MHDAHDHRRLSDEAATNAADCSPALVPEDLELDIPSVNEEIGAPAAELARSLPDLVDHLKHLRVEMERCQRIYDVLSKIPSDDLRASTSIGVDERQSMYTPYNRSSVSEYGASGDSADLEASYSSKFRGSGRDPYADNLSGSHGDDSDAGAPNFGPPVTFRSSSAIRRSMQQQRAPPRNPSMPRMPAAPRTISDYTVMWVSGECGISLRNFSSNKIGAQIAVLQQADGVTTGISNCRLGDQLVTVNDDRVEDMRFRDIVQKLKTTRRPITLGFRTNQNVQTSPRATGRLAALQRASTRASSARGFFPPEDDMRGTESSDKYDLPVDRMTQSSIRSSTSTISDEIEVWCKEQEEMHSDIIVLLTETVMRCEKLQQENLDQLQNLMQLAPQVSPTAVSSESSLAPVASPADAKLRSSAQDRGSGFWEPGTMVTSMSRALRHRRLAPVVIAVLVVMAVVADASDEALCRRSTCLADGDRPCDRSKNDCPPCMYAIPGSYSCYNKIGNACPFPDTLAVCSASTAPTPGTVAPPNAPAPTTPPTPPRPTQSEPVATPARSLPPPTTPTTAQPTSQPRPLDHETKKPNRTDDSPATQTPTSIPVHTPTATPTEPTTPAPSPTPMSTERQDALSTDTKTSSGRGSAVISMTIVVAALFGVLIMMLFVSRRMRSQHDHELHELEFKTPQGEPSPQHTTEALGSARRGRQSNRTFSERINYSTLEGSPRNMSSHPGHALDQSMMSDISEATSSSAISVSSKNVANELNVAPTGLLTARARGLDSSLIRRNYPELAGSYVSETASSERSEDFDIVDPGAIAPNERRNTETLVADGRFRQLSLASLKTDYTASETATTDSETDWCMYLMEEQEKLVIKPYRQIGMDVARAHEIWESLRRAIGEIFSHNASQLSFEELYR
ncbi:hypothetical protein ATCC90586_008444 [Pythium insidiosum]|nr:hypothetical protein ATCC90586_008444 [Pythium insidiosum]